MKTKILILSLTLFVLSSCVKDDLSINHSAIEKAKDDSRGAGEEHNEIGWHWGSFHLIIHYKSSLTQNEIDIIRNYYFNKYHVNYKGIRLLSYQTVSSHQEIWYGEEWRINDIVTYPVVNALTEELDEEEAISH